MNQSKTIVWSTPDIFPENVIALYYSPNDGNNTLFEKEDVGKNPEFFIPSEGDVFGLIEGNDDYFPIDYKGKKLQTGYIWCSGVWEEILR